MNSNRAALSADARLARFIEIDGTTDSCWNWTGARSSQGEYPGYWLNGTCVYAHRHMYELSYGLLPEGGHVHHECHNKLCVNPTHLRALSPEAHTAIHAAECARQRLAKGTYWSRLRETGLGFDKIAELVGFSVGTVKKYISEYRRSLQPTAVAAAA